MDGRLAPGVTSKDIILNLISRIGVGGGTGHVFEYTGEGIRALSMEQRMTICNMSIEGGARAGLIAPDDTTFEYVAGRPHAPQGADFDAAVERWRRLPSDAGASYAKSITIDAAALEPMITYGTNPGMGMLISDRVPTPEAATRRRGPPHPGEGPRVHGPATRRAAASATRSTPSSSAPARTAASATCARPPPCWRVAGWPRVSASWSCPAPRP